MAGIATFGVGLLATAPTVMAAVYGNSDVSIAPYLTEMWLKAPPASQFLMGHVPFYVGFWIFRFLHALPGYHVTWELAPWVMSVGASLGVGWAVSRAAGRTAGLLVISALICAGFALLQLQLSWSRHGLAYVNVMLLGAFAVWLSAERNRPGLLWPMATVVTVMTAAGVATDTLVIVGGLIPFLVVGLPVAWIAVREGRRQIAGAVLVVTCGSVVGAFLVEAAMNSEGLSASPYPIAVATFSSIPTHLLLLVQSVYSLLNGYVNDGATSASSRALGYLCDTAVTILVAFAVVEAAGLLRWLFRPSAANPCDASGGRVPWLVNTAFWCLSAAVVSAAYLGTTLAADLTTRRYLVTVAYAILVLGVSHGARAGRPAQILTVVAVTSLLAASIVGLFQQSLASNQYFAIARQLDGLVEREHVQVVYAGYWDSYSLGWLGSRPVSIVPVITSGHKLFAYVSRSSGAAGIISSQPDRPDRRSMLILDRKLDPTDYMSGVRPSILGHPAAHVELDGDRLNAYVYDYDIAIRFSNPSRS